MIEEADRLLLSRNKARDKFKMKRTVIDSFLTTQKSSPAIGFGSSKRPPLNEAGDETPGPGAYRIKSTMLGSTPDSRIRSTPKFSLRGREKFGSPDQKAMDPTAVLEPGPGHYTVRQTQCAAQRRSPGNQGAQLP
mmetsp:Transcript_16887/g.64321  ORF Transcript_16887/g.64321 Transcript_16887/m.64321 type:complete len:135 (-) Transcript_16887:1170-1574(-)